MIIYMTAMDIASSDESDTGVDEGEDSRSTTTETIVCRHVVPLGHIILIPSQPVFALSL
jgi:hypothetical protein